MPNVKIIVCGSAASWILDNLINAQGGLYNRITKTILLEPFSLTETKYFLENRGINITLAQVVDLYMIIGGIPFYLNQIDKNKSLVQNINELCFTKDGLLYSEFPRLFKSLFTAYALNLKIVKIIAQYRYGLSQESITEKLGIKIGGRFTERLNELEAAGFIQKLLPYGKKNRDHYYRVCDEYTIFYLNWIENVIGKIPKNTNYWIKISKSPSWLSWAGYAFEMVCHKHVNKIIEALDLQYTGCLVGNWKLIPKKGKKENGAQIDLLLDRDDNAVTICEIKYSTQLFTIDKSYAKNLMNKIEAFQEHTKTSKQVFLAMITMNGIKKNMYSEELVNNVVELKALF